MTAASRAGPAGARGREEASQRERHSLGFYLALTVPFYDPEYGILYAVIAGECIERSRGGRVTVLLLGEGVRRVAGFACMCARHVRPIYICRGRTC